MVVNMPEELGETFTEKWRMRHDLLINEIRSLQSHVTTTAETEQSELIDPVEPQVAEPGVAFEPELVQTVESQVFEPERKVESEVVEPPVERPIEPVMEETEEIESASDLGELPSWKRQAKELDRLNARLQSALNLDTCFGPSGKSAAKRCKSEVKKQVFRLSRSTKKLQDRVHGDQDQDHLGLMTSKSETALPTRPSTSPGHSKSVALRPAWDPRTSTKPSPTSNGKEQKTWDRKNKKNDQKDQKAMKDVKHDQKADQKETKGLLDMAKRPVPPQHMARKHTTRGVPARLQVGSPFDQPRMSVMARLSKVQLDTKMPREEETRTKFTKSHNIPQLCLEGLPTFNSAVVPTTMGSSYVPSCTSSPQLWYRPVSPSQGSNVSLSTGGVFRSPQVLQKSSPPKRLAL